ncbi:DUF4189 domain-containing protein [Xanthomonas hortorum pv. vitians]|uniref:DUF4189 domain-containing protein n=2 Tax=Xanthomonas hortorum TaxID=56454 RepID=A0AAW8ZXB6_9XANT|nr:DUF4189 domain-containing protein [Xanthomonas hortorum]MDT7820761.1 DUF4189 domain-containing protein [Xanthomonas hortorum pv. vitians]MDT7826719.1 DUF4189 domain-containing protein [Xanthomonas hortorum pv. vitians]MDV7250469.1 DUF4189 domain-containing protein [Xanthomonas hortorum pv. vitians]
MLHLKLITKLVSLAKPLFEVKGDMKKFSLICSALLLSCVFFTEAFGQTACPAGVAPGSPQCGPDSGTSRGDIPTPPPRPTGEWIKTWGAVATSGSGDAGVSSGRRTKEQAENDAIASCEGLGSGSCRVSMAFFNQCVAAADSGQGQGSMFSAASIEEASRSAIKQCEKNSGRHCKVTLSKCTDPIFKRY